MKIALIVIAIMVHGRHSRCIEHDIRNHPTAKFSYSRSKKGLIITHGLKRGRKKSLKVNYGH